MTASLLNPYPIFTKYSLGSMSILFIEPPGATNRRGNCLEQQTESETVLVTPTFREYILFNMFYCCHLSPLRILSQGLHRMFSPRAFGTAAAANTYWSKEYQSHAAKHLALLSDMHIIISIGFKGREKRQLKLHFTFI